MSLHVTSSHPNPATHPVRSGGPPSALLRWCELWGSRGTCRWIWAPGGKCQRCVQSRASAGWCGTGPSCASRPRVPVLSSGRRSLRPMRNTWGVFVWSDVETSTFSFSSLKDLTPSSFCVFSHNTAEWFTRYTIFTPLSLCLSLVRSFFPSSAEPCKFKTRKPGSRVTKDILALPLHWPVCLSAVPVTTDMGGTSHVNVMMVPSEFGKRLEAEISGPK